MSTYGIPDDELAMQQAEAERDARHCQDPYQVRIGGEIADPYRIAIEYGLDAVLGQALKKLLRSGRKHKDIRTDVRECITTLERWEAIREAMKRPPGNG